MCVLASAAHDKFANAVLGISFAIGILRREALVVVIVPVDHYVGAGVIENLPKRLELRIQPRGPDQN